jgi:hypothetical protein
MRILKKPVGFALAAAMALSTAACDSFFDVERPNIVDAGTIKPEEDYEIFSRSAYQNFTVAYGGLIVHSAWFTNEARVGDTFPTRNDFGLRSLDDRNSTHSGDVYVPLARAIALSETALGILEDVPNSAQNPETARAALAAGYSVQLMAESFCEGVIEPEGPSVTPTQMIDRAIERLTQARDVAAAITGDTAMANMANAARVGLARAYLQKGDKARAIAEAQTVPANFQYNVIYLDDASNRSRLGNNVYSFSFSRESLVVGPEWMAMADAGDTRISYQDAGRKAQDAVLQFYRQRKYTGWASPIRLASSLEARYIIAEAEGDIGAMIDLINERRAASGQAGVFASTDLAETLAELMEQRGRDFWLEGKRMGDWRRNGSSVPYILQPGSPYYKTGFTVGDQTCMPLPASEKDNNPSFK